MKQRLRIAIQKSGRLGIESTDLLKKSGFKFKKSERTLMAKCKDFPLDILFLRVGDIPNMVKEGVVDLGIVGENTLAEKEYSEVKIVEKLGFGKCTLCLAAPKKSDIKSITDFSGKMIATSYANITRKYLNNLGVSCEIVEMSGSHEIAPQLGLSDGICDIVSTGATLQANNLINIETIFTSQAVLVGKENAKKILKEKFIDDFLMRLQSVLRAQKLKSVIMNAPNSSIQNLSKVLGSLKSPTIMPLAKEGWSALHSVIEEDKNFWKTITQLKENGACGILISPIERVLD
ncbi:TPA: ATP phosphoribosyltransferase [Candidatus Peregrinibacteria bacterium]|nr:ATP phosphoribosyltransferase [Candidatus Peregrinibacteria bacterium]HIQ57739.1 ATP phosphoribosyltransferase [Candidatus Gracilibacteria bacterium]